MDDKPCKCFSKVLGPCDWRPADQPPAEEPKSPLFTAALARIAELEQQIHIIGFETEARKLRIAELEAEVAELEKEFGDISCPPDTFTSTFDASTTVAADTPPSETKVPGSADDSGDTR